jgi:hypothetical protein
MHSDRHLAENFFCKLKPLQRISKRYDGTKRNFLPVVHLAASANPLNCGHALAIRLPHVDGGGERAADDVFFVVDQETDRAVEGKDFGDGDGGAGVKTEAA